MRLLLNGAKDTVLNDILPLYPHYSEYVGWLNTPMSAYSFSGLNDTGLPIACDNGCFKAFNEKAYRSMLRKSSEADTSLEWVTVPDVVADARETHRLFMQWQPVLEAFPLAYVLQDGAEDVDLPFHLFRCLFVGGTTEYKLSQTAADIIKVAQEKQKRIHMGRVNSDRRLRYAMHIGVDSVDGTGYIRFRRRELLPALHVIHTHVRDLQPLLF